jgi:hypothetical protein
MSQWLPAVLGHIIFDYSRQHFVLLLSSPIVRLRTLETTPLPELGSDVVIDFTESMDYENQVER